LLIRFLALCGISGGVIVNAAVHAGGSVSAQLNATALLVVVFLSLSLWVCFDLRFEKIKISHNLGLAIGLGLLGLACEPLLEDDHFRYLWDGYVFATHGQVYALPPQAYFDNPLVSSAMQAVLNGVSHPDLKTIYGPLMQAVFALCYAIAPAQLWPLKLLLLGVSILTLWQLHKMGCKPKWILLLVLNPLVIKETTLSAHPDAIIGLIFLGASNLWSRKLYLAAVILVSCSVGLKLSCLVVLALFFIDQQGRFRMQLLLASAVTLAAIYLSTWAIASGTEIPGLLAFGQRWVFNPLIYRLIEPFFSPQQARFIAAILFVCIYLGVVLTWIDQLKRSGVTLVTPTVCLLPVVVILITLSPVNNPWYWLWIMPLAAAASSHLVWLLAGTSLLSYAHMANTQFTVPMWATGVQLVVLGLLLFWGSLWQRNRQ
jgi:alpha-1,6-mannosyltransferase